MINIKSTLTISIILFASVSANASIECTGTVTSVYKWHHMERISVMLSSTNMWINMPTKSDESMALMAFAANKNVKIYWADEEINSCMDGWPHNKSLEGYFLVEQ